jgi:hypothetical protein
VAADSLGYNLPERRETLMRGLLALIVIVWLVIGAVAAYQRGYFGNDSDVSCKTVGDTALTVVAGPLNYFGVNPKIKCATPQPSK